MKVLVLGVNGMLGSAVMRVLNDDKKFEVIGTTRSESSKKLLPINLHPRIISGVDAEKIDSVINVFGIVKPNVVINCIGIVKQLNDAYDPVKVIPINSLFPHQLAKICKINSSRLVQISTDCIFSGRRGMYSESDFSDAEDLYGRSKFLGELSYSNTITLRTSIIGHELLGGHSLINWFLNQNSYIKGFNRAIFSGLPTVELATIIKNYVLTHQDLTGIYHVSSDPISKYDLLNLVAKVYNKKIKIIPDDSIIIDRSLNSSLFKQTTGYKPPIWPELIIKMFKYN